MSEATESPESGVEKELSIFIKEVLQNVLDGVLMAQGAGVPASMPKGVEFGLALEYGDVNFVVPLSNMVFDGLGTLVAYSYGKAKN